MLYYIKTESALEKMRRNMGKSETTRQEIMKVTKELILRKGYAQVTMNDVTQASGMSAGGLYYHYHTVEEIVTDILQKRNGLCVGKHRQTGYSG